jgi:hypothetical protein
VVVVDSAGVGMFVSQRRCLVERLPAFVDECSRCTRGAQAASRLEGRRRIKATLGPGLFVGIQSRRLVGGSGEGWLPGAGLKQPLLCWRCVGR